MASHEKINRICAVIVTCMLLVTAVFSFFGQRLGVMAYAAQAEYVDSLFDNTTVHTIDIEVGEAAWAALLESASEKEYQAVSVVIDGDRVNNVGLRAKGNSSLRSVASSDSSRYSFKLEFDHYDGVSTYKGLDKLSLNNVIQDNTYLKEYLTYHMFAAMGVAAPLCSFVSITVNGEPFGLYVAVEAVEDSFSARNFGSGYGELYKPETMDMDGGMGGFGQMEKAANRGGNRMPVMGGNRSQGSAATTRNSDAALIYTDDSEESYQNIFDGAVFDITDSDKQTLIAALKQLNSGEDLASAVDIEQVLKYFVVHNFVNNFDSYTGNMLHNYYLRESDGLLSMIPWDYNLAFGGMGGGSDAVSQVNFPIDTPVSDTTLAQRPLIGKLLENEAYLALYHQYFAKFMEVYFDSGLFEEVFEAAAALIAPYVESDPTAFCTYDQFQKGVVALKEYCLLRVESVKGQLDGSIPSTQSGQQAAQDALIQADTVNLSDMGSAMGGGGFGGGQGGRMRRENTGAEMGTDIADANASAAGPATDSEGGAGPSAAPEAPSADGYASVEAVDAQAAAIPAGEAAGSVADETAGGGVPVQTPHSGMPSLSSAATGDQFDLAGDGLGMGQNFPGFGQGGNPMVPEAGAAQAGDSQSLILLGASILVLLGGITFAFLFRRKK